MSIHSSMSYFVYIFYSTSCLDNIFADVFLSTLLSGNKPNIILLKYIINMLIPIVFGFTIKSLLAYFIFTICFKIYVIKIIPWHT